MAVSERETASAVQLGLGFGLGMGGRVQVGTCHMPQRSRQQAAEELPTLAPVEPSLAPGGMKADWVSPRGVGRQIG